jgi:glycosyltransferase involved in cell wall biosynthesis
VAYLEARHWNSEKLNRITKKFIAPSNFLKGKMVMGGLDQSNIEVIHNFISASGLPEQSNAGGDYYCYIGRLSSEKGIGTLLKAAGGLPAYKLKIIGTGPLESDLLLMNKREHIEFLGYKTGNELKNLLSGSRFMVIPSEVYENNPLTIIESLCAGTPVLGSNIGGIPELIKPGFNGMLFEAGNATDLQKNISYIWQHHADFKRNSIIQDANSQFDADSYYDKLTRIYTSVIKNNNNKV